MYGGIGGDKSGLYRDGWLIGTLGVVLLVKQTTKSKFKEMKLKE